MPEADMSTHAVSAKLRYLENERNLPTYVASVAGGQVPTHEGNYVDQAVTIQNGRERTEPFSLDKEGFALRPQTSKVSDFYDDTQIAKIYDAEVKELVKSETDASRVEIFDHTRRSASQHIRSERKIREPAATIHNDYTALSGIQRLLDHFADTPDEVLALMKHRFAIVNVWRSISGPVQTSPLALCDATSVDETQLVRVKRQGKDRIGEVQLATWNDKHAWYYFPEMKMDEALLIKTYDSTMDGKTRFTIHTAFDDPNTPSGAAPRESMETRCFAFFD